MQLMPEVTQLCAEFGALSKKSRPRSRGSRHDEIPQAGAARELGLLSDDTRAVAASVLISAANARSKVGANQLRFRH